MQNVANWAILDNLDIASSSGHNSLIQAPIEMIQDAMERQNKALQLSCLSFERYGPHQGRNRA